MTSLTRNSTPMVIVAAMVRMVRVDGGGGCKKRRLLIQTKPIDTGRIQNSRCREVGK